MQGKAVLIAFALLGSQKLHGKEDMTTSEKPRRYLPFGLTDSHIVTCSTQVFDYKILSTLSFM